MFLLGYDIGSSSVKASLVNAETGKCVSSAFFPKTEANIIAVNPGWAEQDPESWWENLKLSTQAIMTESGVSAAEIKAIGISYQMHGLFVVDKEYGYLGCLDDCLNLCKIGSFISRRVLVVCTIRDVL